MELVMNRIFKSLVVGALALALMPWAAAQGQPQTSIRVLTDRSDVHLKPLFAEFTRQTGIGVEGLFVSDGFLARAERGEADILVATASSEIIEATRLGLTSPLPKGFRAKGLSPQFISPDNGWVNMSYRMRGFYVKKGVTDFPKTYEALADPTHKGKICMRSFSHAYTIEMTSFIVRKHGEAYGKKWLDGLRTNLSRRPSGNDRAQVQAISKGECIMSVGSSYYMGLMLQDKSQESWAKATDFFIPNQGAGEGGAFAMHSSIAVTEKGARNPSVGKLLNFLMGPEVQEVVNEFNFEYPVMGVSKSKVVASFGSLQGISPEKIQLTPIGQLEVARWRNTALRLIAEMP